jgi:glutathione S-transferase
MPLIWTASNLFSAADIMMFFPLTTLRHFRPIDFTDLPNIRSYLKRVGERPAYIRAMGGRRSTHSALARLSPHCARRL